MTFDLMIKNARLVSEDSIDSVNLYIADEKIQAVTSVDCIYDAAQVIDAKGRYVFPGCIDTHSHLGDFDGEEEQQQFSTAAAAIGGFTTCIDMPTNNPVVSTPERFQKKLEGLEKISYVDFGMYGALIKDNQDQLAAIDAAGALCFKSFLSPSGGGFTSPNMYEAREALKRIGQAGNMAAFHCEDYFIIDRCFTHMVENHLITRQDSLDARPLSAELLATRDMVELARETKTPIHICHVSHPEVAAIIEQAQQEGIDITGETCAHYLTFSQEDFLAKGPRWKCAPPLREPAAREGLWEYVQKGVLSCVCSDHSPSSKECKDDSVQPTYDTPNGISGIQTCVTAFYNEAVNKRGLSPTLLAREMSANPARRFGLYGRKGALKPGFDADLILFDPDLTYTITAEELKYKHKLSAFVGYEGKGRPVLTLLRGHVIAKDGELTSKDSIGKALLKHSL